MKVIIADTSCLIVYHKINQLEILHQVFTELFITDEVAEEFGELPAWIKIKHKTDENQFQILSKQLGKGEASSIVLAMELENSLLIIDEKKGRSIAKKFNIEIIGSLGILIKAKEKGVIQSVRHILEMIENTDFRISKIIKELVLNKAGE